MLQARFSRPSDVLRTWETQGTAAAELAREDYALRHWVRSPCHTLLLKAGLVGSPHACPAWLLHEHCCCKAVSPWKA